MVEEKILVEENETNEEMVEKEVVNEPENSEVVVEEVVEEKGKVGTTHRSVEVRLEGLTKVFVDKTKKETRASMTKILTIDPLDSSGIIT